MFTFFDGITFHKSSKNYIVYLLDFLVYYLATDKVELNLAPCLCFLCCFFFFSEQDILPFV